MKIRLGTRGSKLALTQTGILAQAFRASDPSLDVEIVEIRTTGDKKQGTTHASNSDKKDWILELEHALTDQRIDLAVHSAKDVPEELEPNTSILPVLTRATPFDAFIGKLDRSTNRRLSFSELRTGSVVGTGSLRRRGCLLNARPDFRIVEHRGNVPSRIDRLDQSKELSGIILACAGLERLQIENLTYEAIPPSLLLPSMNQGILAVQFRDRDEFLQQRIAAITPTETLAVFSAERACAHALGGDCHSAISIFAQVSSGILNLESWILALDGSKKIATSRSGPTEDAAKIGSAVGTELLQNGGRELLQLSKHP